MTTVAEPTAPARQAADPSDALLKQLESVYKDLHANPELSTEESRTARIAADWLNAHGYETTTGIGGTGVIGVLVNGAGPTVVLRADMDALPLIEKTGLDYASRTAGVAHACGHDMHVTWLMGAARILAENRDGWRGTLVALFQPAEEAGNGAEGMVRDGLAKRIPKPAVVLGQHVAPAPAGVIAWRAGTAMSASDSWEVKLFGRGGHGSMPQRAVDPVVMAASAVMRLQGVVSREVAMTDSAVVTVGALQVGTKENIIPDEALLKLNIRSFKQEVRKRVLSAVRRILDAEAAASGAPKPPEITVLGEFPALVNDEKPMRAVAAAFASKFGAERVIELADPASASEDFGALGAGLGAESVFWFVGGLDPAVYAAAEKAGAVDELPANHSPQFAPVIHPTLRMGIEALLSAAGVWLAKDAT